MSAQATYNGEEITVVFAADMVPNDYGVPRSPVWNEPESIEIDSVKIFGVEVDVKVLPKELQDILSELSGEVEFE
jgi:hypothetical protein